MANYPATESWIEWFNSAQANAGALEYEANAFNSIPITIQASGGTHNAYGMMSTFKQTWAHVSERWWGFSLQMNTSVALLNGEVSQLFLYTYGQNTDNPDVYTNYWCTAKRNGNIVAGTLLDGTDSKVNIDCGKNELSSTFQLVLNQSTFVADGKPYVDTSACPSTTVKSEQKYEINDSGWSSHKCFYARSEYQVSDKIKLNKADAEIWFKAGYVLWSTTGTDKRKKYSFTSNWTKYTVADSATALAAVSASAVVSSIWSLVF